MLIKTALRFYLTTVRMASIEETNKSERGQGYRERTTLSTGRKTCAATAEASTGVGGGFCLTYFSIAVTNTMAKKPAYYKSISWASSIRGLEAVRAGQRHGDRTSSTSKREREHTRNDGSPPPNTPPPTRLHHFVFLKYSYPLGTQNSNICALELPYYPSIILLVDTK